MPIVNLTELREHLSLTPGVAVEDNAMLERNIAAAQGFIESWLGFKIVERYGGEDQEPIPDALKLAVLQLAAWYFEHREAATRGERAAPAPFAVRDIVDTYRDRSFWA
jgi:hypothetical protein